jgi:hypothetical protein
MNAMICIGAQRAENPYSIGITSRQERRSRGGADRLRDIKTRKLSALLGDPIYMGSRRLAAEAGHIGVAEIVSKDDDNIGRRLGRIRVRRPLQGEETSIAFPRAIPKQAQKQAG